MVKNPKVSVVMSVYNGEKSIEKTIESVLNQSFYDFEYIIIDDNSVDATLELIKKIASIDNRIRLIENKNNIGLTRSLIKGINESRGKYIARIDCGDLMKGSRLQKQVQVLENNESVGLVSTNCLVKYVTEDITTTSELIIPNSTKKIKKQMPFSNVIPHVSVMFNKKVYYETGEYRAELKTSQDFDLWIRMLKHTNFYNIEEFLTEIIYDSTVASITLHQNNEQRRNGIEIVKKAINEGSLPKWPSRLGLIKKYLLLYSPFIRRYLQRLRN